MSATPWPREVQVTAQALVLHWSAEDADPTTLPAAYLRARCQCTHCRRLDAKDLERDHAWVLLMDAKPVGTYGLQLVYSDGHDRGIYPWYYLRQLGDALLSA